MSLRPSFPWISLTERRRAAPRMSAAAVRIPDPRVTQLPLAFTPVGPQIFVHEGARQALERRLEIASGGPVQLSVTDNRHTMLSHTRQRGTLKVRVHMMFLGAPERVQDALARYLVTEDRPASLLLSGYIAANNYRIRASRRPSGPLRTRGAVHDLGALLDRVNELYFGGTIADVLITWGRKTSPRDGQRSAIKLGSYSATERLIRIHPSLDRAWVPRYFVSYVVFHELLHHVVPAVVAGGRASLHSDEFRRREREFRHYERAIEWERRHIARLLRAR